MPRMAKRRPTWDAGKVKALRQHLSLTQDELAQQMGTRQQTISEWETGMYAPRGVSEELCKRCLVSFRDVLPPNLVVNDCRVEP